MILLLALATLNSRAALLISKDLDDPKDFAVTQAITAAKGEVRSIWIKLPDKTCLDVTTGGSSAKLFSALTVPIKQASFNGGMTGDFIDPLKPVLTAQDACPSTQLLIADIAAPLTAGTSTVSFKRGTDMATLTIKTVDVSLPAPFPLYVGMSNITALKYHCNSAWCGDPGETGINALYPPLLKEHLIVPIQSNVIDPQVPSAYVAGSKFNFDDNGALSFRNTSMQHQSGMVWFPSGPGFSDNYYKMLELSIKSEGLTGRAFAYAWDEPNLDDTNTLSAISAELDRIHVLAPDLKRMVTHQYDERLKGKVDIWVPVADYFDRNAPFALMPGPSAYPANGLWLYTSCMAHGCGPNRQFNTTATASGDSSGVPDLVIDRQAGHARGFLWLAARYPQVTGLLYYSAVEQLNLWSRGVNVWLDQWNFSGNGDGTLVYPVKPGQQGSLTHQVWPSLRLKRLREGINDLGWVSLAKDKATIAAKVATLIADPSKFKPDYQAYQGIRDEIANSYLSAGNTTTSTATSTGTGIATTTGTGMGTSLRVGYLKPNTAKTQWSPVLVAPNYKVPSTWQKAAQWDEK